MFRELLMNHKDLRIVGGSTRLSEHHWKYDKPFYEFFQVVRLEPLTREEIERLLLFWAGVLKEPRINSFVEKQKGSLEALRILSDGMPRTILHLLELIIQKPEDDSFDHLRTIVDRATPIYQERLGVLSAHQRKVLLELSFFWDSAPVSQLSESAKMPTRTLSAVLNKLSELRLVEKLPGKGKNNLYRVRERFFNLWMIMTQGGPRQKRRVLYLTRFLELWYGIEGMKEFTQAYKTRLGSGVVSMGRAALLTQAIARSRHVSIEDRDELIQMTRPLVNRNKELLTFIPETSKNIFSTVLKKLKDKAFDEAIGLLHEIEQDVAIKYGLLGFSCLLQGRHEDSEQYYLKAIEKGDVDALNNLAILYKDLGRHEDSEQYYLKAIEKGDVDALNNLAILYKNLGRHEDSEQYYLKAIEKGHVDAFYNLAILYKNLGRHEDSEQYYLKAIEKGHVKALNNLAILYKDLGRHEDSEQYYLKAIEKGHVDALNNLAILYKDLGRHEDSEQYYLKAIEKGHVKALNNLAILYGDLGRHEDSEQYYLKAIEKGHVKALNNLASLYGDLGRHEDSEQYYLKAIEKGHVDALYNLVVLHYWMNVKSAESKASFERYEQKTGSLSVMEEQMKFIVNLWHGVPEANTELHGVIERSIKSEAVTIGEFLKSLLIHHQTNQVWELLTNSEYAVDLKELAQPVFFVCAKLVGQRGEEAFKTMPPELEETVQDILESIANEREKYSKKN